MTHNQLDALPPEEERNAAVAGYRSGISPQTLVIASLASAAASFAVARIWGPGTLLGAATAPVIVALVSETLRRPMRTVFATTKKVPQPRRTAPPDTARPVADVRSLADAQASHWRPHWGLALATGLAAFAIVVGVFTIPDLLAGSSVTGNGQPTTFFGGSSTSKKTKPTPVTTASQSPSTGTSAAAVSKTAPTTPTIKTTTTATTKTTSAATTTSTATTSTQSSTTAVTPTTSTGPPAVSTTTAAP
jgi:hypothetical protein